MSPILIACFEGHSDVVEMLLEKGVNTKNRILRGPEYKTLMREIARVSDRVSTIIPNVNCCLIVILSDIARSVHC